MKCKKCEGVVSEEDNFCAACGTKLRKMCNCWIKKDNYDCGESSCPGHGLYKLEKLKSK